MTESENKPIPPLRLIEDEPVADHTQDELGLLPWSSTVAAAAMGSPGPFTIGVFGEWGTGKTSMLRQVKSLIDKEGSRAVRVFTVWFNAWQYEREEHLIVPLLASIVEQLEEQARSMKNAAIEGLKKITAAARAAIYGISFSTGFGVIGRVKTGHGGAG